jgi:mono/diheme cytochrome c family protein
MMTFKHVPIALGAHGRSLMTRRSKIILAVTLLAIAAVAAVFTVLLQRGFSARAQPNALEAHIARRVRRLAIPRIAREAKNPVPGTPEILAEARAHFADHCAICHANDGSGNTEIGQNLYPPAPDMRKAESQMLSDGELFYFIHNGIRFTGMPAWGPEDPAQDQDSWKLVHFIRHLLRLSKEEIQEMKALNPKSRHELEEEEEVQGFLRGEDGGDAGHTITH